MLSKKEIEELIHQIEPLENLALHNDADGIASAVLLSYALKIKKVFSPADFGVWELKPWKVQGSSEVVIPPDACVDMIPQNPDWPGKLCIDHHPGHVPEAERKYRLIHGDVPTTVIVYNIFKDLIPREQRWKVAVGAVGDGQPEVVPPEIWTEFPELLETTETVWTQYNNFKGIGRFPLFLRLSSPINASCRIPDKWFVGYSVLRNAKSPLDIVNDSALISAKDYVDREEGRLLKDNFMVVLRNGVRLVKVESEYTMERSLAFKFEQHDKTTTIVVNEKTNRGSIRGVLSTLLYNYLQTNGFKASGHPGFGGIKLDANQTFDDLYKVLIKLKI
jgi:hypothetical protein